MPFFGGFQYSINNNRIVYVADVLIPAAFRIKVDHITEATASHGVDLDAIGQATMGQMLSLGGT